MSEVQELVWALIDEQATETQVARLEQLLLENDEARRTYVMCMQMHADLHFLLGNRQLVLPAVIEQAKKAETAKAEQPKKAKMPLPSLDLPSPATSPWPVRWRRGLSSRLSRAPSGPQILHDHRHHRDQNDRDDNQREVLLDKLVVAEPVAAENKHRDPGNAAHDVVDDELGVVHRPDAGHKRRERPHDRHEASDNDRLAAVFLVEGVRAIEMLLLEEAEIAAERLGPI